MAHHLAQGRRAFGVLQDHLAVGADAGADLQIGELGNEFRHRIVEEPVAFLEQDHHRRRRDRLGHRIDAEDGVRRQRNVAAQHGRAVGLESRDLAVPQDQGRDARDAARLDHSGHIVVQAFSRALSKPRSSGRAATGKPAISVIQACLAFGSAGFADRQETAGHEFRHPRP
jgi:hypothetical protein